MYPTAMTGIARLQRSLAEYPVSRMLADLATGVLKPNSGTEELRERYPVPDSVSIEACMSHACRAHADLVGAVLVTDAQLDTAFGQISAPEDGASSDFAEATYRELRTRVPAWHVARQTMLILAQRRVRSTIEYPIFVMPRYAYGAGDGPAVGRYGEYFLSFNVPLPFRGN